MHFDVINIYISISHICKANSVGMLQDITLTNKIAFNQKYRLCIQCLIFIFKYIIIFLYSQLVMLFLSVLISDIVISPAVNRENLTK